MKHLGIISLILGSIVLIYRGVVGMQSNTLLYVGMLLVLLGLVGHILLNKRGDQEA